MSRRHFFNRKLPRTSLVALLVFAMASPQFWHQSATGAVAATEPATDPAVAIARLNNLFNALQEAESEIPRDTFDPNAVAAKCGMNSGKIFEWVRDQTFYVPYRGTLRGATGVLMDRVGNSLDRALCLAAILRSAGYTSRLANAQLNDQDAEALLARIRPVPQLSYGPSPDPAQADHQEARYVAKYDLDLTGAQPETEASAAQAMNVVAGIVQRATDQSPLIIAAIGKPKNAPDNHPRDLAAIKDLWWVQFQQGTIWQDLDPTTGDAKPGEAAVKATRTVVFDAKAGRFTLEPALLHLLKIRIVSEKWEAGKLSENTLLEHELRPADVIGQRIAFANVPLKWPDLPENPPEGTFSFLKNTALNTQQWLPIISIGDQRIFRAGVNAAGVPNESPIDPKGAGELGRGIGGVFGNAIGGEKPTVVESFLTAQWIDYKIDTPGAQPRIIRRQVFDLVGPAARAAGAVPKPAFSDDQRIHRCLSLNGVTEILPQPCRLSPEFCADLMVRRLLANRGALLSLAGSRDLDTPRLRALAGKITPLPGAVYDLAQLRWLCSPVVGDVYLDRINVIALVERLQFANPAEVSALRQFDIVDNDVAVRSGADSDAFSIRVTQGVIDTNAEALLLKTGEKTVSMNAGELLNNTPGIDRWAAARKPADLTLTGGQFSADINARIVADVSDGQAVLVPRNPPSGNDVSWWRVDPTTGQTLGIGLTGAGQALTEYAVGVGVWSGLIVFLTCTLASTYVGKTSKQQSVKCMIMGVGAGLGMAGCMFPGTAILGICLKFTGVLMSGAANPL